MKKLFLSFLTASTILIPGVVKANEFEEHNKLWKTLQDVGVITVINHLTHCNDIKKKDGIYYPYAGLLVICQDKMVKGSSKQFAWTENDYNTLRHEAQHVVQDCAAGSLADGKTRPLFNKKDFQDFIKLTSYTEEMVNELYQRLKNKGVSDDIIAEEIEAYVVSVVIDASSIEKKIIEFCTK